MECVRLFVVHSNVFALLRWVNILVVDLFALLGMTLNIDLCFKNAIKTNDIWSVCSFACLLRHIGALSVCSISVT